MYGEGLVPRRWASASGTQDISASSDGNLWFTDYRDNDSVGVTTLSSSELLVTQQPPPSVAFSAFGLTLQAVDGAGDVISSFNGAVTMGLGTNTNNLSSPSLGGTTTATASGGVATFTNQIFPTTVSFYHSLYASGAATGGP